MNQTHIDPRLTADLREVARLEDSMGWHDAEVYVTIAQLWTAESGTTYMTGNIGRFPDRAFALKFMDDNPDMFSDERTTHALVIAWRENSLKFTAL